MTSNVVDAKPKTPKAGEKGLAIGETPANVFNCPSCARALSEGTSVCPNCGAHLIMGVLLRRAGLILALGAVIGMLIGGGVMASVITLSLRDAAERSAAAAAVAAATPVPPSPVATVVPTPPAGYTDVGIPGAPAGAATGLRATAVVNERIALDAETLAATLARKDVSTIELARALRSLAADAALGRDLTARMIGWSAATAVVGGLDRFYLAISDTARSGLRASLADAASYRAAATAMLAVLDGLESVDADSRGFAASLDLEVPRASREPALTAAPASPATVTP